MDIVIPIVFPDYLIAVNTPATTVRVPDLLPFVDVAPDVVRIPATKNKLPELGHAGVLFIDGARGTTKYYEYGRYDKAALGLTRRVPISDVKITNGKPTTASLQKVLGEISRKAGQGGRISGAYIEVPDGSFEKMLAHAQRRVQANTDPNRAPYTLTGNSCMHFSKEIVEAAGKPVPWIVDPRPNSFIQEVQQRYRALEYRPGGSLKIR